MRQQIKSGQRESEKVKNELKNLQQNFQIKESGVRSDVERMWNEWQEKLDFTEGELQRAETRITATETDKKTLSKQVLDLRKENRTQTLTVTDSRSQLQMMQEKYEDMISIKDTENKETKQQKQMIEDSLQNEIEFFKKEVARLSKAEELKKQTNEFDQFAREPEKEVSL